jgi:hypothetical protein
MGLAPKSYVTDFTFLIKIILFHIYRQSRMHKRRVDLLEGALAQVNPQYYLPVCRQMWFELAEVYSEMLEIKKQKLRTSNEPTAHALSKINTLAQNGITHLNNFINSMYKKG